MWFRGLSLTALLQIINERDRRYEQHFEGQERAVAAALAAQEKAVAAALGAAERAVLKAETAAEKRFEAQNEFRGQLSDQAARLLPRAEAGVEFANIREKLDALGTRIERSEQRVGTSEGRSSSLNAGWGYLVGATGILSAIAAIAFALLHH